MTDQRETILALRRHEHGGPNFTPAVHGRGWNAALVAVLVALDLDTEDGATAEMKRRAAEDDRRSHERIERFNEQERAKRHAA